MKRWILPLLFVFSSTLSNADIQFMTDHAHDVAPHTFKPHEAQYLAPHEVEAGYLKVVPMKIEKFTKQGEEKLARAFRVLEEVVNSEEFKERVINFKNDKGERAFASNNGLSNEEIYQTFMAGVETLQPETPSEMNFYLSLYNNRWSRVIGQTSPNTNLIKLNNKFFKGFKAHQIASNLAHEWTHKIGFDHSSAGEHDSAPYAIGYIVGELAERIEKK